MEKYIVISQQKNGDGDIYPYLHDTLDAANADADMRWRYLTRRERERDEILVVSVDEADLDPSLESDESDGWDGEHDWFAWSSYRVIRDLAEEARDEEARKVILNDCEVDFYACVNLMDDEIREALHAEGITDQQEFIDRYVELHAEKYDGEQFEI